MKKKIVAALLVAGILVGAGTSKKNIMVPIFPDGPWPVIVGNVTSLK